ncbi:MAG: (2Fe-2S)-binding protein [Acidimicrobiaceae bacterium]|nr:(2Fe-2S)-binding protein [Acidimicrobiaceae bacterium]
MTQPYEISVNGRRHLIGAEAGATLLDVIRTHIGLTGTKQGCDDCECGACIVLLDGKPVNSCSYLAVQAADREVTTIEGLADRPGTLHPIQRRLLEVGGVQCGFCTAGVALSATALLSQHPDPSRDEIGVGLAGNLCRCTGYSSIITAIERAAQDLRAASSSPVVTTARQPRGGPR